MKVIAIKKGDVIVQVSKNEFANLLGLYSRHSEGLNITEDKEYDISKIYTQHYELTNLLKTSDYNKARAKLEEMLKLLTPIELLLNDVESKL